MNGVSYEDMLEAYWDAKDNPNNKELLARYNALRKIYYNIKDEE